MASFKFKCMAQMACAFRPEGTKRPQINVGTICLEEICGLDLLRWVAWSDLWVFNTIGDT